MKEYITPELIMLVISLWAIFAIVRCICDTVVTKEYIRMIVNKNVLEKRPHINNNRYITNEGTHAKVPSNKKLESGSDE